MRQIHVQAILRPQMGFLFLIQKNIVKYVNLLHRNQFIMVLSKEYEKAFNIKDKNHCNCIIIRTLLINRLISYKMSLLTVFHFCKNKRKFYQRQPGDPQSLSVFYSVSFYVCYALSYYLLLYIVPSGLNFHSLFGSIQLCSVLSGSGDISYVASGLCGYDNSYRIRCCE